MDRVQHPTLQYSTLTYGLGHCCTFPYPPTPPPPRPLAGAIPYLTLPYPAAHPAPEREPYLTLPHPAAHPAPRGVHVGAGQPAFQMGGYGCLLEWGKPCCTAAYARQPAIYGARALVAVPGTHCSCSEASQAGSKPTHEAGHEVTAYCVPPIVCTLCESSLMLLLIHWAQSYRTTTMWCSAHGRVAGHLTQQHCADGEPQVPGVRALSACRR